MADEAGHSNRETAPDTVVSRKPYTYRYNYSCRSIPWTDERIARLKELWARGELSASQIASELGVTRNSVLGKVDRLGLASHEYKRNQYSKAPVVEKPRRLRLRPQLHVAEPEAPTPVPFLAITFAQLNGATCRYPRGDDPMLFCGQPTTDGASYCPYCHALTHMPTPRGKWL